MIQAPAIISGVSTRVDGGLGIRITTNEIPEELRNEIFDLNQKFGWFAFKEDKSFDDKDMPKEPSNYEDKSPSKRLRAILFVLWKEKQKKGDDVEDDFEVYYRKQINRIIETIKEKLEPM